MQPSKMMGFETPGDQRVPISVREWNGMKLAAWRSRTGWEITVRAAREIIDRCRHADGCPGAHIETEPCLQDCPDREQRMDALVILSAARMFAPIDARRAAADPYSAPSREYFSEMIADLASAQAEIGILRATLQAAGVQVPSAPEREEPALFEKPKKVDFAAQLEAAEAEAAEAAEPVDEETPQ